MFLLVVETPGTRTIKKRLSSGKALLKAWRDFVFGGFLPPHIG